MFEAFSVLALVFVTGFGLGYGVRSQMVITRRARIRRRM
jgi:hypothetical protein